MKNGLTIKDATERWVHEMNAIPQGMIEKLMNIKALEPSMDTQIAGALGAALLAKELVEKKRAKENG